VRRAVKRARGGRHGLATQSDRAAVLALLSWAHRPTDTRHSHVPAGPPAAPQWAAYPPPAGGSTAQQQPRTQRQVVQSAPTCEVPDAGASAAQAPPGRALARWIPTSQIGFALPWWRLRRALAAWLGSKGTARCRWSRGRRLSGCDSEATDSRAGLPQSHPGGVGGPLTQTRPRRACRLQGHSHPGS
jgi:hypothetical protein